VHRKFPLESLRDAPGYCRLVTLFLPAVFDCSSSFYAAGTS
jgi:hypothetical protein